MFLQSLLISSVVIFVYVTAFYLLALKIKNNTIADIAWGSGITLIALTTLLINQTFSIRSLIITLLVFFWGARLSVYIFLRNNGKKEDFRYEELKKKWGNRWKLKSYVYVFLVQGLLMLIVASPVMYTNTYGLGAHGVFDRIGVLLWIIGFYFEAVGDWQLYNFKKRFKNKIMTQGLWKYTRHPNYFGESMMWWGIYVITLSDIHAWWTIIGPLFITYSLLKVSGVTLLEKRYAANKEYREYQKQTSVFIPWLPKH